MRIVRYDPYTSLARFIEADEPLVMVDVGANVGSTTRRMLDEFPHATVYAFEPAPDVYRELQAAVGSDSRIHTYSVACGSSCGEVDFYLTQNHWCSSVLPPSDIGRRFHGAWYNTREVVKVPVTTLDAWALAAQVRRVDFLKVDAQGFDLEVLKGAQNMLASGVMAVNCECHFVAEYEGCATFSQIDHFLESQGFRLHQMNELWTLGIEEQSSYCDALWLRRDVLAGLSDARGQERLTPIGRVARTLRAARARGLRTAAVYGCGRHTQAISHSFDELPVQIVAIIDDNPSLQGTSIAGRPVIGSSQAGQFGIDVVVLSSDAFEAELWRASAGLRQRGIVVLPVYGRYNDVAT